MTQPAALTQDDITRLMQDPSAGTQMDVVSKLSAHYNAQGNAEMNGTESALAEDIFKLLLARAEVQVRSLIAINLKESDKLPPEIAEQMAADVNEVALPILQRSTILSEEYLLKIVGSSGDKEKLMAIARREVVSENLSAALVDTKVEQVVSTLVSNEGAQINEKTFNKIVENHPESAAVMEAMLERGSVPMEVIDKLVDRISGNLRNMLEVKYGSLVEMKELRRAFDRSLELTTYKLIGLKTSNAQLARLIKYLNDKGQLSPFSALCMANLQLFQVSMARMMRIPLKNVQQLCADPRGLQALYARAELPESMFEAVRLCVQAILELENEGTQKGGGKLIPSPFQVVERMRKLAGSRTVEGLDYMVSMMQQQVRENIRQAGSSGAA